ncbi:MAG: polysaccharide biosynthesis C-terminal domain-containing protein [Candidatus Diapherotrites archaeon]
MFIQLGLGSILMASTGNEKKYVKAIMLGVILNVALNLALIPSLDFVGAALAVVIAEVVFFFVSFHYVLKEIALDLKALLFSLLKITAASAVMSAVLLLLFGLNVLFLVALGAVVFILCAFLLRAFSEEELGLIRKVLGLSKPQTNGANGNE